MTKNEFLTQLESELRRRKIADADDIVSEYEQHFAFKMSDGYSEEEIAAKLGDPEALASQFGEAEGGTVRKGGTSRSLLWVWALPTCLRGLPSFCLRRGCS